MKGGAETITCQDWYRVRRGEDQIAWGRASELQGLPGVVFSERAHAEWDFLEPRQREALAGHLRELVADPFGALSAPILHGGQRRISHLDALHVIFTPDLPAGPILLSTIRGGPVLDPEATGPAPCV